MSQQHATTLMVAFTVSARKDSVVMELDVQVSIYYSLLQYSVP